MVIPLYPHQFPASKVKLTKTDGSATEEHYWFNQTIFNRTGGASGIPNSANGAVAAAGINQTTATKLVNDFNHVTTGSGGVMMTALKPGQLHWVWNDTAGNLNVYPAPNGQINSLAVNQPYVLAPGTGQLITSPSLLSTGGTFYKTMTLG